MKNFIQPGDTLTLTMPYARLSGEGVLVGSIFGVCSADYAISTPGEVHVSGVFDLRKTSAQAWTVGVRIYWDDTARECTTTVGTNRLIGVATEAAANPSPTGRVRLSAAFTL